MRKFSWAALTVTLLALAGPVAADTAPTWRVVTVQHIYAGSIARLFGAGILTSTMFLVPTGAAGGWSGGGAAAAAPQNKGGAFTGLRGAAGGQTTGSGLVGLFVP